MTDSPLTHFGYKQVPENEKAEHVKAVFSSVASNYDLMNDLMSLGIHRHWKRVAVQAASLRKGMRVCDVAGGTGDMTWAMSKAMQHQGEIFLTDINAAMLQRGRERLLDRGAFGHIQYVLADAEQLPFAKSYFDVVMISFGLRNVTRKQEALNSMFRILKPGGKLIILEFSKPVLPLLAKIYDQYSFSILPKLGEWVAGDAESYRYLAESIRMHPDQDSLKSMLEQAGFADVSYENLTGGIVAIHAGYKY